MLKLNLKGVMAAALMLSTALAGRAGIVMQEYSPADYDVNAFGPEISTVWSIGTNTTVSYDSNKPIMVYNAEYQSVNTATLQPSMDGDIHHWDIVFNRYMAIDEPGYYFIIIPNGALKGDVDEESEDAFIDYEVAGSVSSNLATVVRTKPANGETVAQISHIDTWWDGIVGDYSAGSMVQVRDSSNTLVAKGDLMFDWNDPTYFTVDFNNTITTAGTYRIVFPEGALSNEYGDPGSAAYEMTLIIGAAKEYDLKFGRAVPADGETFPANNTISLYFPEANTDWELDFDKDIPLKDASGNVVAKGSIDFDYNDETHYPVTFSGTFAPGQYTVEVPEGILYNGTKTSEPATLHYTVAGGASEPFTFESIVPSNNSTVDFNKGGNLAAINMIYDAANLTLANDAWTPVLKKDGTEEIQGTISILNFKQYDSHNTVVINFEGADEFKTGTYTLDIPAGLVTANGAPNEALTLSWNYIQDINLQDAVVVDPEPLEFTVLKFTDGTNEIDLLGSGMKLAEIPGEPYELLIGTNKNYKSEAMLVTITDLQDKEFGDTKWTMKTAETELFTKHEDGLFHFYYAKPITLYEGHTYKINIEAFRLYDGIPDSKRQSWNDSSIFIEGTTPQYKYSDVEIVSVSPAAGSELDFENNKFTVTYSAPVDVVTDVIGYDPFGSPITLTAIGKGISGKVNYEKIISNSDKTQWTFTIPEAEIRNAAGSLLCMVAANDENGVRVRPAACSEMEANPSNTGEENETTQLFEFTCFCGNPTIAVVPGEGVVTELYEFEFTAPDAPGKEIMFSGVNPAGENIDGTIRSTSGARVATLDREDFRLEYDKPEGANDRKSIKVIMHLDKKITSPGNYVLDLPSTLFNTGSEFSSAGNAHTQVKFTIEGDIALDAASIKDNSIVRELGIVAIYSGEAVELGEDARMVLRRKGSTREVTSAPLNVTDAGNFYRIYADFSDPEQGYAAYAPATGYDYELVVAEGAIKQYPSGTSYVEKVIPFSCPEVADVETVNLDITIAGHAMTTDKIAKGQTATVALTPAEGWKVESVKFNGSDVTNDVKSGSYTTPALNTNSTLEAAYAYDGNLLFADETNVAQIEGSNISVSVVDSDIIVNGVAKGDRVDVYSISGSHIAGHEASDEVVRISVSGGIYVVTINGKNAVKVIVK